MIYQRIEAKSKREAIVIAMESYIKKKKIERLIDAYGSVPLEWTRNTIKKYRTGSCDFERQRRDRVIA